MNKFSTRVARGVLAAIFSLFMTISISAQPPAGFIDARIQGGYIVPMGIVFSKDGLKMFVWEKRGLLWVSTWNGTTYVKQGTATLDIGEEVGDWRDFGLQSVALDPNFDTNGLIYLFYQVDRHHLFNFGTPQYNPTVNEYFKPSISRVSRYKLNNVNGVYTTDYASRKVLLGESKNTGVPLVHESHAGGQIVFGTDGTLLVTTGDNASYASVDVGSAGETYWQQAVADGIMRPQENVGALRSQMLNSHCGKLLRLDPNTGNGVPSNPHYDAANPRSAQSRVWALGLRNPYRMSFKPGTGSTNPNDGNPGTVLVADVQWNTWEDMHMIEKAGTNCGWPIFEGIEPTGGYFDASANVRNQDEPGQPSFQSLCKQATSLVVNPDPKQRRFSHFPPALDWRHGQNVARYPDFSTGVLQPRTIGSAGSLVAGTPFGGNCATSGTFYTGTAFPVAYQNTFFFADYASNWIKAADLHDNNTQHQVHSILDFAPNGFGIGIVDIEYCPFDQSIFYVNLNNGEIHKISFGSGNRPPVAVATADRTSGASPLTVNFNSAGTTDPDGNPITYLWDFGDGTTSTVANPQHVFNSTGPRGFTVTLTVKDNGGLTDTKTLQISTNNTPPSVKITNPVNNSTYTLAQATQLTPLATVTDNDAAGMQYAWQLTLRHNTHEHREPIVNQQAPTMQISPIGCDGETYYYLIELTVTDNGGLSAKDSVKIYPDCNSANISIKNLVATPGNNSTLLTWQNPSTVFDEVLVAAKEGSGFIDKPNGTAYTADVNFTGVGTAIEGGKVVYRGTGNLLTVTGLTAGKTYFFRVYTRKGTTWSGGVQTSAIPTGTIVAPQLGCLKASYFNNTTLTGTPTVVQPETSINYDWGVGAPTAGIGADNFSVRWEGVINPPVTGAYTFTVVADNGVRLWVNNVLVLDKWLELPPTTYTVTVNLTQAQNIPIKMEYFEVTGGAIAKLNWTIPNQASQVVGFNACPITQPPVVITAQPGCLKASYFNNTTLTGTPTVVKPETSINYDWGVGIPTAGIGADNFSVRWEGVINPPITGAYTFTVVADNGVRLWVNNVLVLDKWLELPPTTYTVTVNLTQAQNIPIKMEFFEVTGGAIAKLNWTIPNQASQVLGFNACPITQPSVLTPGCLKASYFNNITLTGTPAVVKPESTINYDWGIGIPTAGIGADNFSVRWEGVINPPVTGAYTFTVVADDGVRLWVNNALVLDKWIDQPPTTYTTTVNLAQAQNIPIKMEFYERGGGAAAKLNWTIPNQASQVVGFNACPITQPPVAAFDAQKCYRLTARHSGKVLEIATNSTLNGVNIQQNTWNGGRNQVWRIKSIDGTFYNIVNGFSGKSMDVSGISFADGANIHQWDYINGGNQQWRFDKNTEGYYFLTAKHSNKVADVAGLQTTDGANVIQWTKVGGNNQQWAIAETGCPIGTVALQSAQIYAADGYREGRKAVITWVSNADAVDYFEVEKRNESGNFETIALVKALPLSDISSKNLYSYVDNQPTSGENIYRVKLIFRDNSVPQWSNTIQLDFKQKSQYTIYPNPSSDYIDVDIEPLQNRTVLITIIDAAGRPVKYVSVERAEETQRVELEGLPTGQYILLIHSVGMRDVSRVFNISN